MSHCSTEDTLVQDELGMSTNSTNSDLNEYFPKVSQWDSLLALECKGSKSVPSAAFQSPSVPRSRLERGHPSQDGSSLKSSLSTSTWEIATPLNSHTVPDNLRHSKDHGEDYTPGTTYPPRPPKVGNEWVWFPEGYWAERNIVEPFLSRGRPKQPALWGRIFPGPKYGNRGPTTGSSNAESAPKEAIHMPEIPVAVEQGSGDAYAVPTLSESDSRSIKYSPSKKQQLYGLSYISPTYPHFLSPSGSPEGLYCKAKRGIEEGLTKKREKSVLNIVQQGFEHLPSQTTETFQDATSALEQAQHHHRLDQERSFATDDLDFSLGLARTKHSRGRLGVAPWHRRESQDTMLSATSTILDVLRGKTPTSTPNLEMEYHDYHGNTYSKVNITNSTDSNFLPSEAQRVHTPPTRDMVNVRARDFPFDFSPSHNEEGLSYLSEQTLVSPTISRDAIEIQSASPTAHEWWDEDDEATTATILGLQRSISDTRTPEHLPSSPLCPINPKHKSGGIGICVYHGGVPKVKSDLGPR